MYMAMAAAAAIRLLYGVGPNMVDSGEKLDAMREDGEMRESQRHRAVYFCLHCMRL